MKSFLEFMQTGVWLAFVCACIMIVFTYIFMFDGCQNTNSTDLHNDNIDQQSKPAKILPNAELMIIDEESITHNNAQLPQISAPGNIVLPDSFSNCYDYYIGSPDFYLCDSEGNIYQLKSIGMAVKMESPVKVILYVSDNKDSLNSTKEK